MQTVMNTLHNYKAWMIPVSVWKKEGGSGSRGRYLMYLGTKELTDNQQLFTGKNGEPV